jgi:hypothetical protein
MNEWDAIILCTPILRNLASMISYTSGYLSAAKRLGERLI